MNSDPSYPLLTEFIQKFPNQAGCIYSTYTDLALSQQWLELRLSPLGSTGLGVIFGRKTIEDSTRMVLPLHFHAQDLTPRVLRSIYKQLSKLSVEDLPPVLSSPYGDDEDEDDSEDDEEEDRHEEGVEKKKKVVEDTLDIKTIYISIVTPDSSVVYYKLTQGIKKPDDIPDE